MKNRIGVIVLVVVCIGLGIALIALKKQASDQKKADSEKILTLSNNWFVTSDRLNRQEQVNRTLEKDVETQKGTYEKALMELTNNYTQVSTTLAKTEATLKEEVARRDARIAELEVTNQKLDKQALDLSVSITNLTVQIAETQRKLAASEGDKAFLEKELKRLMSEKAELERQFNDLTVMRAQVAKLKEELNIARRLEWIRQGLFASAEERGAQKLMRGLTVPGAKPVKPSYDLNVEVSADGSVKVIPPLTNAPAK